MKDVDEHDGWECPLDGPGVIKLFDSFTELQLLPVVAIGGCMDDADEFDVFCILAVGGDIVAVVVVASVTKLLELDPEWDEEILLTDEQGNDAFKLRLLQPSELLLLWLLILDTSLALLECREDDVEMARWLCLRW